MRSAALVGDFRVPGKPGVKGRPRFARGHAHTSKATKAVESQIAFHAYNARPEAPIEGPVGLAITFVFKIPKSWTKAKTLEAMTQGWAHTSRKDLDNMVKAVCDAMQTTAAWFEDDSQVVALIANKRWGRADETHVQVYSMQPLGGDE
jgi:Holliday junction resolvase RusA-like endonuclease